MITFKEVDKTFFELYDKVDMKVNVHSEYKVKRINNELDGILLEEVPVEPFVKDLGSYERATEYEKELGKSCLIWEFLMQKKTDINK